MSQSASPSVHHHQYSRVTGVGAWYCALKVATWCHTCSTGCHPRTGGGTIYIVRHVAPKGPGALHIGTQGAHRVPYAHPPCACSSRYMSACALSTQGSPIYRHPVTPIYTWPRLGPCVALIWATHSVYIRHPMWGEGRDAHNGVMRAPYGVLLRPPLGGI